MIDPTKVSTALQNGASVATLLLTSDALIADKPKAEGKKGGGWAGHGGDYDIVLKRRRIASDDGRVTSNKPID